MLIKPSLVFLVLTVVAADGESDSKKALPDFTAEREAAARAFVRLHHRELNALLDRLRPMNPVEYEKAIAEIFKVSEDLAALKKRDPRRHPLALESWKAKSRVELLAAQQARKPSPEMESSLRQAIEAQVQCELALKKYERDQVETRLQRLDAQLAKLESDREKVVQTRLNALLKKAAKAQSNPKGDPKP